MVSDFNAESPLTLDALPEELEYDYEDLWENTKDRLTEDNTIIDYLDFCIRSHNSVEGRVRFLCFLSVGRPGVDRFVRKVRREQSHTVASLYLDWYAIRLLECTYAYAGRMRVRSIKNELVNEWKRATPLFNIDASLPVKRILGFIFHVLIPLTLKPDASIIGKSPLMEETVAQASSFAKVTKPTNSGFRMDTLESICLNGMSPNIITELLHHLGVVDVSGVWPYGNIKGKGAKALSAFPAVYRALCESHLLERLDAPVWCKIFQVQFKVSFSVRLANYALGGTTSAEFDRYHKESVRWIAQWKVRE